MFDLIVPDGALAGIGLVHWRVADSPALRAFHVVGMTVAASLEVPPALIGIDRHGWTRWPSMRDLFPVMTARRDAILYASLPPQHGRPTLGADDFRGWPYPRGRHARR